MLWLAAKKVDIGHAEKILNFAQALRDFVLTYGDVRSVERNIRSAEYCIELWNSRRLILVPFCLGINELDLSFLRGVANLSTLEIVCARKTWSVNGSGYMILGFRVGEAGIFELLEEESFFGFGSSWKILNLGSNGYTIFVHIQGTLSIQHFAIENDQGRLIVAQKNILTARAKELLEASDEKRLARFVKERQLCWVDSNVAFLARRAYNVYWRMQNFNYARFLEDDSDASFGPLKKKEKRG